MPSSIVRAFGNNQGVISQNEEQQAMSDLYEAGFIIDLGDDLSEEIQQTLNYMIGRGAPSVEPQGFEHPLFHVEGYETEWGSIISSPREDDEEMLGAGCGSILIDNRLAFRGLLHDDPFWNVWHELMDWLSSISYPSGLIGYYRNLYEEDDITLISFESAGVSQDDLVNYSDFEDLQEQIIEMIESGEEE